jgi:hypothetical protein
MDPNVVIEGLGQVKEVIVRALRVAETDQQASPVLLAVLREFTAKVEEATGRVTDAGAVREAVVELEQAGHSAKVAADADPGIGRITRETIAEAHLAIRQLKAEQ